MNVVGLDLSTKRVGFACADGELVSITAHADARDPYRRLHEIMREIARTFATRPPKPDLVVVEDYSLYSPGNLGLIRLGEIGGGVRMRLFELDMPLHLVRPASVKLFATGNGNANKEKMIAAAIALGARGNVNDDEADAFHLRRMGLAAHGQLERDLLPHEARALAGSGPW